MKRLSAALLLLPWFIPLGALARPAHRSGPKAAAAIQVPVSSQFVGADGVTYVLSGTLTLQGGTVPPPPPPPPPTDLAIAYLMTAPSAVTAGQSAVVTVVMNRATGQDTNVAMTGDPGVRVPLLLTIPAGQDHAGANVVALAGVAVQKLLNVTATYNGHSASSNLLVMPDGVVPPVPTGGAQPVARAYLNADGSPLIGMPVAGQEVRIKGDHFGLKPGVVIWQGAPLIVTGWSDTEIKVAMPAYSAQGQFEFGIFRPDGGYCNIQLPDLGQPGHRPSEKRR